MQRKQSLACLFAFSAMASASSPRAYISLCCAEHSAVSVYSRVTGVPTANLPGATAAQFMALSPDGRTLYLNGTFAAVSVTDTATGRILATIPLTRNQGGGAMAVSPDGAHLYVGDNFSAKLYVIDTATNTIAATPSVDADTTQDFVLSPDGKFLYVNNNLSIVVFDTRLLKTAATFPLSEYGLVATPGNKSLLGIANAAGALSLDVIDAATGVVTASIPLGPNAGPGPIAVSRDGNRAYAAIGTGIGVVDLNTNQIVQRIPAGTYVFTMTLAPDNATLYAILYSGILARIDLSSSQVNFVAVPEGSEIQLAVSPDGQSVLVLNKTDSALAVVDLDTQTQIALAPIGMGAYPPAVTPDRAQTWVSGGVSFTTSIFDSVTRQRLPAMVGRIGSPAPFNPKSELVYGIDYYTNALAAIGTKTHRLVKESAPLPQGDSGNRLVVSGDGRTVYVNVFTGDGTYKLLAYDAASLDYLATIHASAVQWLAQNPRLPYIYSFQSNAICAIDTRTNLQVAMMTTPHETFLTFMAVTPDGTFGYAGDGDTLYGFNLTTNQPAGTVAVRASSVAFSPDGRTAYAIWYNRVSVIDRAAGVITNSFTVGDSSSAGDSASSIEVASIN